VTDKLRLVDLERGRSKNVIGVDVGHHHVFDRELSCFPNRGAQPLAVDQASARVDDRHRVAADDEADVGYGVFVLRRHVFIHATTNVNPRCDFLGDERVGLIRGLLREGADAAKARASEQRFPACYPPCV
jgi:hypothetical protein